jgi:hypothetical protein
LLIINFSQLFSRVPRQLLIQQVRREITTKTCPTVLLLGKTKSLEKKKFYIAVKNTTPIRQENMEFGARRKKF